MQCDARLCNLPPSFHSLPLGLHTAANIHDASGVNSWEHMYGPMASAMGMDPAAASSLRELVN